MGVPRIGAGEPPREPNRLALRPVGDECAVHAQSHVLRKAHGHAGLDGEGDSFGDADVTYHVVGLAGDPGGVGTDDLRAPRLRAALAGDGEGQGHVVGAVVAGGRQGQGEGNGMVVRRAGTEAEAKGIGAVGRGRVGLHGAESALVVGHCRVGVARGQGGGNIRGIAPQAGQADGEHNAAVGRGCTARYAVHGEALHLHFRLRRCVHGRIRVHPAHAQQADVVRVGRADVVCRVQQMPAHRPWGPGAVLSDHQPGHATHERRGHRRA